MRLWFAVACALSGCGLQSIRDGGMGGSSGMGGSGGSGGGATAGGSATGGGGTAGGSANGGGGPATLTYAALSVTDPFGTTMVAVSGRAGEVYALTDLSAGLYRSTGAGFTRIAVSGLNGGRALYVASDGSVFIATPLTLYICRTNCGAASSYTAVEPLQSSSDQFSALCGDAPTNVFALVTNSQNEGALWHYDGQNWSEAVHTLGIDDPQNCVVSSDGTVIVPGTKNVAFHKGGGTTVEQAALAPPLAPNDVDFTRFYGVAAVGTKVFVGGLYRRISIRSGPNQWAMSVTPSASDTVYAMGGPSESEVFAGHSHDGTTQLHVWDGASLRAAPELPVINIVRSIYVAGPNEIYFAGQASGAAPAIVKAYR